jgi:Cu/Ag efflux pump CusA
VRLRVHHREDNRRASGFIQPTHFEAVQIGLAGQEVSEVWIGQRRYELVVKLAPDFRRDAATLAALLVDGHDGSRIPLGKLAKIEPRSGLARSNARLLSDASRSKRV